MVEPTKPMEAGSAWWPEDLGHPASSAGQNDVRCAVFPDRRRLAVQRGRAVSLYDTADHRIGGVSQHGGGGGRPLAFASQMGEVTLDRLERVG